MSTPSRYGSIAFSAPVAARQRAAGSLHAYGRFRRRGDDIGPPEVLEPRTAALIAATDSFFIATVTPTGWPYVQHRGGPTGFVHVLDAATIAFADYSGNEQYVTVGNLDADDRVALFFVDYPTRTRVKVYGRARIVERSAEPDLIERLLIVRQGAVHADCDRAVVVAVEAFDNNCRRNIPPKYGAESVRERVRLAREELLDENAALKARVAELEQRLAWVKP
ncbi:pyridoxamine 5'-phosphate oxidase family protein [Mycobacterium sp. 050134]|uniref:pyridoxamine 5'-phosphate oxidase family protein n=1 Tax=Mycobacterium sp. 050134 TaxID=3096111 RepID=UPI002ED8A85B